MINSFNLFMQIYIIYEQLVINLFYMLWLSIITISYINYIIIKMALLFNFISTVSVLCM